jgi:hypothetical protein
MIPGTRLQDIFLRALSAVNNLHGVVIKGPSRQGKETRILHYQINPLRFFSSSLFIFPQ